MKLWLKSFEGAHKAKPYRMFLLMDRVGEKKASALSFWHKLFEEREFKHKLDEQRTWEGE